MFAGSKAKHQMELSVIAILFITWILPSMISVGAMILCILVSAVFGAALLAARYISEAQEIYFSLECFGTDKKTLIWSDYYNSVVVTQAKGYRVGPVYDDVLSMAWVFLELIVKSMALEQSRTFSEALPPGLFPFHHLASSESGHKPDIWN